MRQSEALFDCVFGAAAHVSQHTGAPDDEERMVGDLGNIEADESGAAKVNSSSRQSFRPLIS